MIAEDPPTPEEVEKVIVALLAGDISRDEADQWAAERRMDVSHEDIHPAAWTALERLHGCDLTHGPGLDYLHSDRQIEEWLEDLRSGAET